MEKEILTAISEVHGYAAELYANALKVRPYVEKTERGRPSFLNLSTQSHASNAVPHPRHTVPRYCVCQMQDAPTANAEKSKSTRLRNHTDIPVFAEIIRIANKDKKWAYGKLSLVLFKDIGDCRIQEFTPAEFEHFIKGGLYAC